MRAPALLVLEDGSLFWGRSIGAHGLATGEVVFNTALTGYQEILSDPSYARQIVTLTGAHVGNVGTNDDDDESGTVFAGALVTRDVPAVASNWRATATLEEYLSSHNVVGITDIDTRRLTRLLRTKGALRGCVMAGDACTDRDASEAAALNAAREFPGLLGMDLAKQVTTERGYDWSEGQWQFDGLNSAYEGVGSGRFRVVAYDFGIKRNILRLLASRGCAVTVVPAKTTAAEVIALKPQGVFLSNGPGDPEPCDYAIESIRQILRTGLPIFGICLGHQLLGLAGGARTVKMKFGHHGANHPVQDLESGVVYITSQNHGFAVEEDTLPSNVRATHRSLFDGSLQGVHWMDRPAFGFQGHPEASPGPHDIAPLFDHFVDLMSAAGRGL